MRETMEESTSTLRQRRPTTEEPSEHSTSSELPKQEEKIGTTLAEGESKPIAVESKAGRSIPPQPAKPAAAKPPVNYQLDKLLVVVIIVTFFYFILVGCIALAYFLYTQKLKRMPAWDAPRDQPPFDHFKSYLASHPEVKAICLSEDPPVWMFENFATSSETTRLIVLAKLMGIDFTPSLVAETDGSKVQSGIRTSSTVYLPPHMPLFTWNLESRIAELTGISTFHGEPLSVNYYKPGQFYTGHHDYLTDAHIKVGGQRVATALLYLNQVEKGGETRFLNINFSLPHLIPDDGQECWIEDQDHGQECQEHQGIDYDQPKFQQTLEELGITRNTVSARTGRLLLWYNVNVNGDLKEDPRLFHEGAPVLNGTKTIVTKWIRFRPYIS